MFIDYESTGDSTSSQSEIPQDSDVKFMQITDKLELGESQNKQSKDTEIQPKTKKLARKTVELKDPEVLDSQLKKVGDVISNRVKQAQHPPSTTRIFYLTSLEQEEPSTEERANQLEDSLESLQEAIRREDVIIIQQTIIVTVETISTWLETIEYKIQHTKQSSSHGTVPEQRLEQLSHLQEEISRVESGVAALGDIVTQSDVCGQQNIRRVIDNLQQQVATVEETAKSTRNIADNDLARWEEFLNGVNNISVLVEQLRCELEEIVEDQNTPSLVKLKKLESLEATNHSHKAKCAVLLSTAHGLLRDFPGRVIPLETYTTQDTTQAIEHNIGAEREKLLQLVSLAEEYEQTLKDFAQITDVAESLVDGPIVVSDLQHLQEEMQKHRKFFVNLSHCRGILESLEGNLDSETRTKHSALHDELHRRASMILDKAAGRAQQMALAASRWTVLEQGMKEERGWLQVANQRVPDLSSVTTSDYNQYISLYQALSSDIALHAARAGQLVCVAHGLQGLVQSESCAVYDEHHAAILALQAEVNSELGRLLAFRDSWTAYELLTDKLDAWVRSVPMDTTPANMRQFWELKAQFELHKHLKDEAAAHLDTALRVIPVEDETVQRQLQTLLLDRWKALEARLDSMQTIAMENLSAGSGSVEDKLSRLERELTELATLLSDMHGVIKTEEELQLYIERLQVMRGSVDHIMEQLSRLGLLSTAQSDRVSSLLGGARAAELSLREELEMATLLRDRLAALRRGVLRVRRDQQRASSVLDQCEASLCENQDTVQQALVNCQGVEEALTTQWGELMILRQLLHTLPSRMRLSMSPVRVERELTQLQDDHSELTARCKLLNASLAQRLALWRRFYSQLELVQQSVRETDYMMEILAVQGQVDYERLVKATERLEGLSESLGERESQLEGLRAAAEPLQSSCSPEVAREIEAAVTEVVAAWEDTVTSLQGLCTRYQHAVQLWKQYREASETLSKWADNAVDTVDSTDPHHAVEHVKVCEENLASQQARLAELQELVAQIAADVGLDPQVLLGGEVTALGAKLEDVRESLAALVEAAENKVEEQERCAEDLQQAKDFLTTVQKSLQAVDSSGDEGTLEQLTALRNHLIALGKSDGQIQVLRDKNADLPPSKQDISVMDILQLWQQVFRETFQQYHRLSTRLVRDQEGLEALRLWEEYLLHVQAFLTSAIPDEYNALSEHQNLCQVHQNLLSSQQSLLLNKPEASVELSVAEQFNSLTNLHNETLARIMEREAQVRNRMNIWDQYRHDHKSLLAWLGDAEKEKNRLRLRYVHMRVIPRTIQRIQVMLDKLPVGEEKAEKLGAQLQQLCQFCDETLATSLRLEHSAITDKINSMRAALYTWLKFLEGLRELTERYEREVEAVQRTFSDIHVALEDNVIDGVAACVPASHHRIQQRLDALKAARERVGAVSTDLELLGVTQEQLKESLNPVDVKTVSQRVWLLQQQQGDLEHQLDMAIYQLEERLRQGQMFDKRAERFLVWTGGVDRRLEGLSSAGAGEPADQLRRLETELEAEVGLRRREADWLRTCGTELVEAEGLEATPRRAQLTNRLSSINTAWERVQQLTSARANKLRQIIEGMSTLEQRIEELRGWLHSIELQLATPIILEQCTQEALDKCMAHHDALTKDIEQHSGTVADVLNHCELLLNDCDSANVQLNTDGISTSMQLLERRWKNVCVLVTERKAKLLHTWQLLQDVRRLCEQQAAWLRMQTEALDRISTQADGAQIQAIPGLIADVEKVLTEVECQRPALELLQSSYTSLATQSALASLTTDTRARITEWSALRTRAEHLLSRLHAAQDRWLRFTEAHGTAVLALTNIDVQLTQIDLLDSSDPEDADLETHKNKLKKLMLLKQELEGNGELLKRADQLGLEVMNNCLPQDVPSVQQMVDEYQQLWKNIMERMKKLIEACKEECRKRNVVHEEVQVETLKFETDTSVQVNTLPVPLLRRDAYIYELQTAIKECNSNLDALAALEKLTTQNSAKCIAACQSSVDLVRHLSGLLVEQCGASEEQACSSEVEQLEQRYQRLLAQKQTEDREQRELSESGRFTCPLCTRRNWKQLDNDLWRLQKWLEFAEATQAAQTSPPSNINQLEEVIQDHREFLLDLDSHKSLVVSLNTVGRHLAEHTEDEARAQDMTQRLAEINQRWDSVCESAAVWETILQTALLQNPEFHETIDELVQWLEQTEIAIQQMEPVDVADGREVIESKYNKFKDLRHDLEVCEPRVLSLQEAACHLLRHRDSETTNTNACERLTHLRLRLQSLTRLTGSYLLKLGTVLGKDPISHASLATLSHELLDQAAGGASSSRSSTDQLHSNSEGLVDTSVLARGYRFLGRVVRASLPIQALMLVMLGVASLVPITEEDFACSISRAFGPTLRYVNGPPPM